MIRAYGKATSENLDTIGIVERRLVQVIHVTIDYTWLGKVERELRDSDYIIKEIQYLESVQLAVYVNEEHANMFCDWMVELTNGKCEIKKVT